MRQYLIAILILLLLPYLGACQRGDKLSQPNGQQAEIFPLKEDLKNKKLSKASNEWFATAGTCLACHQNIEDAQGKDVSPAEGWRATMMANSARDPYFLASVNYEIENSPPYEAAIQAKCATCHTPMARFSAEARSQTVFLSGDQSVLAPQHPDHSLAMDGVSCTVCHQIPAAPQNLSPQNGELDIDLATPFGQRKLYGPFPMSRQSISMMAGASGFEPVESEHIRHSALCATCHELYLNYLQADGSLSPDNDTFAEQTPFSEWLASDYGGQKSCQDCHLARAEGEIPISNLTLQNRYSGVSLHNFVGGNAYMLSLFNNFGNDLGVEANTAHFRNAIDDTLGFLQSQTATLEIRNASLENGVLTFALSITVQSGHKFPTSFPSRRAWLHLVITDAQGERIFESGGYDEQGQILENENDRDPTAFEPHYDRITSPQQVQIYEAILHDIFGRVTTTQLHAAGYLKDNRLLPRGFDKDKVPDHIAVYGDALIDSDFTAGGDTLSFEVEVGQAKTPLRIEAELLYQTIGYRWAKNVMTGSHKPALNFARYWQISPHLPIPVVMQFVTVP